MMIAMTKTIIMMTITRPMLSPIHHVKGQRQRKFYEYRRRKRNVVATAAAEEEEEEIKRTEEEIDDTKNSMD